MNLEERALSLATAIVDDIAEAASGELDDPEDRDEAVEFWRQRIRGLLSDACEPLHAKVADLEHNYSCAMGSIKSLTSTLTYADAQRGLVERELGRLRARDGVEGGHAITIVVYPDGRVQGDVDNEVLWPIGTESTGESTTIDGQAHSIVEQACAAILRRDLAKVSP